MRHLALLMLVFMLVAGCGGARPALEKVDPPQEAPGRLPASAPVTKPAPFPDPAHVPPEGPAEPVWAEARLLTDGPTPGRKVEFQYVYTNQSGRPLALSFNSGQVVDLVIERDGKEVWRLSQEGFFIQQVVEVGLGAGQSKSWRLEWDGRDSGGNPVPPGPYTARMFLTSRAAERSAAVVEFIVR